MRTLKKTLSLVLVVAMVLGLCVVGASAYNKVEDFTDDVDKIGDAYYEAVGVLTGIQVIDGMTETSFQPQGNYTREQAAKIIAYMMLGKADADSLRCTKAPFDDVAADRWSAGYIAFCVEQGIIDGMTETTFEPTGTLTGFQWAKMLLCAVGFGVKGEFTGSSWSLNTAKYAHNVDLFAGDLAGADHTAITREQAALYAFNVLTAVDLVVYSESLGDYIKGYNSWFVDRYTPQGTLAETVFGLHNVVGVIVDNEGMGASVTYVDTNNTKVGVVKVAAKTDLNLMYHAARVWYVAGKTNTGVFTYDLAKATKYECGDIATGEAAATKMKATGVTIGELGVAYEYSLVDNSAAGFTSYGVKFVYDDLYLGVRSDVNKTTVIGSYVVNNANIKTDISKIDKGAYIIVLAAESVKETGEAWYVYAPTATSGAVKSVAKDGTITLTDGTALKPSNIAAEGRAAAIEKLIGVLTAPNHVTPTYYFVLDTHGHYMSLSNNQFMTVALYTGATKITSNHGSWSSDVTYAAQFVDVATGEVKEVPVTTDWYNTYKGAEKAGYFDITDELYGDASYYPDPVFVDDYLYGTKYANSDKAIFSIYDTTNKIDLGNSDYARYDADAVTFIIASYSGSKLVVNKYVGVKALVEAYAAQHKVPVTAVSFDNIAIVYSTTAAYNKDASVVFAFEGTVSYGGVVFFPKDVGVDDWNVVSDNYYAYNMAYLNGEKNAGSFIVSTKMSIARGFYTYTINERGYYEISRQPIWGFVYDKANIDVANNTKAWITDRFGNEYVTSYDCKVVDTRTGAGTKFDAVTDFTGLLSGNLWDVTSEHRAQVAYMLDANKQVSLIYVVDYNLGLVDFTLANELKTAGWSADAYAYEDGTLQLNNTKLAGLATGAELEVKVSGTVNGKEVVKTVKAVVDATNQRALVTVSDITGLGFELADITIVDITQVVTLTNGNENFTGYYLKDGVATEIPADGVKLELKVGDKVSVAYKNEKVANGTYATAVYMNGSEEVAISGTFSSTGSFWINDIAPLKNSIVLGKLTAAYRYEIVGDDAKSWGFSESGDNDSWLVTDVVPGVGVAVDMKNVEAVATLAGYGDQHAQFNFGGAAYKSGRSASEAAANWNSYFNFTNVVPGAVTVANGINVVTINGGAWVNDTNT